MQRRYYNTSHSHLTSPHAGLQHNMNQSEEEFVFLWGESVYILPKWGKRERKTQVKGEVYQSRVLRHLWAGAACSRKKEPETNHTAEMSFLFGLEHNIHRRGVSASETTVVWAVLRDTSPVPTWDPSLDIWGRICAPVPFRWRTWLMENYWTQMRDNIITGKNVTIFDTESSSSPSVDKKPSAGLLLKFSSEEKLIYRRKGRVKRTWVMCFTCCSTVKRIPGIVCIQLVVISVFLKPHKTCGFVLITGYFWV